MNETPTAFDCRFPYRLSDDEYNRIIQVNAALGVLSALSGQISVHDRTTAPAINVTELHLLLWGLFDALDTVAAGLEIKAQQQRRQPHPDLSTH